MCVGGGTRRCKDWRQGERTRHRLADRLRIKELERELNRKEKLVAFGAPMNNLSASDLATDGIVFQLGVAPNRIDILNSIDGVAFRNEWAARVEARYGSLPVHVIGLYHLIQNKEATGRRQDLIDAAMLRRHKT